MGERVVKEGGREGSVREGGTEGVKEGGREGSVREGGVKEGGMDVQREDRAEENR